MEETSKDKTWILEYIGGSGERLRFPLLNGTEEVFRGIPIVVNNYEDYRRLMSAPHKYKDVTPKEEVKPLPVTVVPEKAPVEKAESPATPKGGKD